MNFWHLPAALVRAAAEAYFGQRVTRLLDTVSGHGRTVVTADGEWRSVNGSIVQWYYRTQEVKA